MVLKSADRPSVSRDCPQKATNGDLAVDAVVDLGVAPVPSVAPVA